MDNLYKYNKKNEQTMIDMGSAKLKKKQFVEDLREGDVVNDIYAVKIKNPPRQYKKGVWFDLVIIDKTGEINLKYWGGDNKERVKRLYDSFKIGDVIQVRLGNVEIFADKPQISVNETVGNIKKCKESEYDITNFVRALEKEKIQELLKTIKNEISKLKNNELRALLELFFSDSNFSERYCRSPSAITHHHNYVGGNLEHTLGVLRIGEIIAESYDLDRDLILTGAILHDIGKIETYDYDLTTERIVENDKGRLIGHIIIGQEMIQEKIELIKDFPEELAMNLKHLILSHHGKIEWGSPVEPATPEALALHHADLSDSQVKKLIQKTNYQ